MNLGPALLELDVPEHRPGFLDDLRGDLGQRKARFTHRRLLLVAAAAALVAGVFAFGFTRGTEVASAAQVRAAIERARASTGSISGIEVSHSDGSTTKSGGMRFVLSSTGAFQAVDAKGNEFAYDPTQNAETFSIDSTFIRIDGLAAGPPDAVPEAVLQPRFGSVLAALANDSDTTVENATYEGRPAWLLHSWRGDPAEETTITVDRATGMPVREQVFRDGHLTYESRIEHLRVSSTVPRITLLSPSHGQTVQVTHAGFHRTSLAGARAAAGYAPLVPTWLPHGYALSGIAFASSPQGPRLVGLDDPDSRDVVSLSYRRGFDQIIVTTRRTGADPSAWTDPFTFSPDQPTGASGVTFTRGALAGQSGYLVLASAFPRVWTAGPKLVVTVTGTLSRTELLKLANSLQETR
jgi:hypothetical protein